MEKEIRSDQCHAEWMTPKFFSEPSTISRVYEDESGPILYLRGSSALRLHIQFCDVDKERIRKCLVSQFPELVQSAKRNGYKQIIYDTASKTLAWFCRRYLGFVDSPEERVLWLTQPTSLESTVCQESTPNIPST